MYISLFTLIIFIGIVFYFGIWTGTKYFYNVKYHIDSLWKRIHKLSAEIGKARQNNNEEFARYLEEIYEPVNNKDGKLINALLLHYFDLHNDEDKEYIELKMYGQFVPSLSEKYKK